jgi:hypothetical protein
MSFRMNGSSYDRGRSTTWTSSDEPIIPISPTLQQVLLEPYARRRSKQWVCGNQKGQPDGHILEKLKKIWSARPPRPQPCMRYDTASGRIFEWRSQLGRYRRPARPQGPGDDPDRREGSTGTPVDGRRQAHRACSRSRNRWCVTQSRHTRRAECDDSQKLLEAVDLGDEATGMAERASSR